MPYLHQLDSLNTFLAAVGYLVQGGAKFAGYEYWKKKSGVSDDNVNT